MKKNNIRLVEPKQIQLIKIAQKQLKMSDEDYYTVLLVRFQVSTCKDLTYVQAEKLLHHFEQSGFKRSGWRRKGKQARPGGSHPKHLNNGSGTVPVVWPKDANWLMSPGQRVLILQLLGELGWTFDSFLKWMPKQFKFTHPGNKKQATQVINRLLAIRKKDIKKKSEATGPSPDPDKR